MPDPVEPLPMELASVEELVRFHLPVGAGGERGDLLLAYSLLLDEDVLEVDLEVVNEDLLQGDHVIHLIVKGGIAALLPDLLKLIQVRGVNHILQSLRILPAKGGTRLFLVGMRS